MRGRGELWYRTSSEPGSVSKLRLRRFSLPDAGEDEGLAVFERSEVSASVADEVTTAVAEVEAAAGAES